MAKSNFIHLHLHTRYSFLDGANDINDCINRCKELEMDTVAITDHGNLCGLYDFREVCKENNIKPIYGCEMYQTWDTRILSLPIDKRKELAINKYEEITGQKIPEGITTRELNELIADYMYDTKQYHLILLAMNQTGFNNLIKLQSEAADICTYNGRYCCDFELLEKYNEGLICLSACLGGIIPNTIEKGDLEQAEELIQTFKNIFGNRYYLEIQPHCIPNQYEVNLKLIEYSKKYNIELVATNDVHYTLEEDADDHDTLLCIGIGKNKNDPDRMRYAHEYWIRSEQEMYDAFYRNDYNSYINEIEQAINNTRLIADRIDNNIKMGSDKPVFPKVTVPKGLTAEQYLSLKTYKGLYEYYAKHKDIDIKKYEKRIVEELNVINPKGFAPYFLKILENNDYCKENDIPVGPGRGSAAGSLVLFCCGGTKVVDPIKYDLLFFRFLTKDRKALPDVDMDYSYYGRDKLINHLEEVHGKECVAHIGTITALGVKSGLKDFARVLEIPFNIINNINKEIDDITDNTPGIKFKDIDKYKSDAEEALKEDNDKATHDKLIDKYNRFKKLENDNLELFRLARKFEGCPRNMGVHASGVLVTDTDVTNYVPTRVDPKKGVKVCLFTGPQVEELNLVKLDLLGLRNLDVLDKTLKSIDKTLTVDDLYEEIINHTEDQEIFQLLRDKETEGLFQVESDLFKALCDKIQPTSIEDLIV